MDGVVPAAFTLTGDGPLGKLITDVQVGQANATLDLTNLDRSTYTGFRALWDTGASKTCITPRVATALSVPAIGKGIMVSATERREVNIYACSLILPNNMVVGFLEVMEMPHESDGVDLLIGMDIIRAGDFCITNQNGRTKFTFRIPSIEDVDYVQPVKPVVAPHTQKRNSLCYCGSGKKYKRCHGQ